MIFGRQTFRFEPTVSWSVMTAFLVVCVCHQWYGFDIWYHIALGREVFQLGSPSAPGTVLLHQSSYRNIYWVFQVITWFVYSAGGMFAVSALLAAVWLAIFAFWATNAGAFRFPLPGIPFTAAAIIVCQLRFEERPEVLSYLFLAVHLWLIGHLARGTVDISKLLIWVTSQVLWTNVHGYFVLGPLVLVLWIACSSFDGTQPERVLKGWQILAVISAATLISPFGLGTWVTAFAFAHYLSVMKDAVVEFRPYPFSGYGWTTGFFWSWSGLIAVWGLLDILRRRPVYEPALAVAGVALAVSSARNAPLAVLMSGPLLRQHLPPVSEFMTRRAWCRAIPVLTLVLVLTYTTRVLATGSYAPLVSYEYSPGSVLATDDYPVSATEYLRRSGFSGSVFAQPGDGSYLEYALPAVQPYADTRFIDAELTSQYFRALRQPTEFAKLHARWNFDSVLINIREDQTDLISLLANGRDWALVYADPYRCVLANRHRPAGAALVQGPIGFYSGQKFERAADYNAAGSWLQGFAEAGRPDLFAVALRQLGAAPDFPPEFRAAARAYGLNVRSAEILDAARPPSRSSK